MSEISDFVDDILLGGERRFFVDWNEDILWFDIQMDEIPRMNECQTIGDVQKNLSKNLLVHVALSMMIVTYAFREIST